MIQQTGASAWRRLIWPSLFALLALALLLQLGFWQLRRLAEKEALMTRISQRMAQAPLDLATLDWTRLTPDAQDYAPAVARGTFIHDDEALVFEPAAKGADGAPSKGYHVLTPLRLEDGRIVIVDRGFVPEALGPVAARVQGQSSGMVEIHGRLRAAQRRGPFTPPDTPEKNLWFTRDPAAMAAWFKLANVAPLSLEADDKANEGGWPKGGNRELNIPNRHLEYAVTWFGLAATLIGVYAFFAHSLLRRGKENSQ